MKVLITGAAGFIGSALCRRLASGNKVIGVDITGPPMPRLMNLIGLFGSLENRVSGWTDL